RPKNASANSTPPSQLLRRFMSPPSVSFNGDSQREPILPSSPPPSKRPPPALPFFERTRTLYSREDETGGETAEPYARRSGELVGRTGRGVEAARLRRAARFRPGRSIRLRHLPFRPPVESR